MGRKLVVGQEYRFTMVVSPRGKADEQVEDMYGEFIPDRGDTIEDIQEQIIKQHLGRPHRDMCVLSFNYS
jgi:hypothetical protein